MDNTKNNYNPKPIDVSKTDLPRDLETLWEKLAENNHDMWAEKRMVEGWVYGEKRNDDLKQSPCLIPYYELPESEKTYDRDMAKATLAVIREEGYNVTKQPTGKIMLVGRYDDQFIQEFKTLLEAKKLKETIVLYKTWEDAEKDLKSTLSTWHAIIFDTESEKDGARFLRNAIDDMSSIFIKNYNEIPWYICHSQTKCEDYTKILIQLAVGKSRENKLWGKADNLLEDLPELVEHLQTAIPSIPNYRMRMMYEDVFNTIDEYFDKTWETEENLANVLLPMHYPEKFHNYKPTDYSMHLRKVLEAILLALIKHQLIPNQVEAVIDKKHTTISSLKSHKEPNHAWCIDHLTKSDWCDKFVKEIFKKAKSDLDNNAHVTIENLGKSKLYHTITSYALQLADVILWIGEFIEQTKRTARDLNGEVCFVSNDNKGKCHYKDCLLPRSQKAEDAAKNHKQVQLKNVRIYNHYLNKNYLYIADLDVLD